MYGDKIRRLFIKNKNKTYSAMIDHDITTVVVVVVSEWSVYDEKTRSLFITPDQTQKNWFLLDRS